MRHVHNSKAVFQVSGMLQANKICVIIYEDEVNSMKIKEFIKESWGAVVFLMIAWLLALLFYLFDRTEYTALKKAQEMVGELRNMLGANAIPIEKTSQLTDFAFKYIVVHAEESFKHDINSHAAIALFVAGLLAVFEIYTRWHIKNQFNQFTVETSNKLEANSTLSITMLKSFKDDTLQQINDYKEEIASDVWNAISRRLIPRIIAEEVQNILKSEIIKENCIYTITLGVDDYEDQDIPNDLIISRCVNSRTIRNLSNDVFNYPLRANILNPLGDINLKRKNDHAEVTLPRYTELNIDNLNPEYLHDTERTLNRDIELPKNGAVNICTTYEEQLLLTGSNTYTTAIPTSNLTVRVINNSKRIKLQSVELQHPRYKDFIKKQDNLWVFEGGMLPGQSFTIHWRNV